MIKSFISVFWEGTIVNGISIFERNDNSFTRAKMIVSFFYLLLLVTAFRTFTTSENMPRWDLVLNSADLFVPIWTLKWFKYVEWSLFIKFIYFFNLLSSVLVTIFWQRYQIVRVLSFLGFLFYISLISSFGSDPAPYNSDNRLRRLKK